MKKLLIIALLVVGCDNSTETNGSYFVSDFPAHIDNQWIYSCNIMSEYSNGDTGLYINGFSSLRIMDYNLESDSCGQNIMIIEKADSIISFDNEPLIVCPDTIECIEDNASIIGNVFVDTIIYSISQDTIEYCTSIKLFNQTINIDSTVIDSANYPPSEPEVVTKISLTEYFRLSKPPYIIYPLFVGNSWAVNYGILGSMIYEVIGIENVVTEMLNGNIKMHNCYIIKKSGLADLETYYYVSSEGIIKSNVYMDSLAVTTVSTPDGVADYRTWNQECILVDYINQ